MSPVVCGTSCSLSGLSDTGTVVLHKGSFRANLITVLGKLDLIVFQPSSSPQPGHFLSMPSTAAWPQASPWDPVCPFPNMFLSTVGSAATHPSPTQGDCPTALGYCKDTNPPGRGTPTGGMLSLENQTFLTLQDPGKAPPACKRPGLTDSSRETSILISNKTAANEEER